MYGLIGPSASVARQPYGWPPLFAWHPAMLPRVERGAPFPPAPPMAASVPISYFPCLMSRWAPGFSFLDAAWLAHSHTLPLCSQGVCLARGQIPESHMGLEPPGHCCGPLAGLDSLRTWSCDSRRRRELIKITHRRWRRMCPHAQRSRGVRPLSRRFLLSCSAPMREVSEDYGTLSLECGPKHLPCPQVGGVCSCTASNF